MFAYAIQEIKRYVQASLPTCPHIHLDALFPSIYEYFTAAAAAGVPLDACPSDGV